MPSGTFFNLPQQKRDKLILAAKAEFSRVPYDEASINRIIHGAGIPRGSFYMYFTDKEDLFRYLLEGYYGWFVQMLQGTLRQERGDLFEAFCRLFDRLMEQKGESGPLKELAALLRLNAGLQQGPLLRSISPDRLMEAIVPEIDQSRLSLRREGDLEKIIHILFSVTIPSFCAASSQPIELAREYYLAKLDILSRGMAARQAASPIHQKETDYGNCTGNGKREPSDCAC